MFEVVSDPENDREVPPTVIKIGVTRSGEAALRKMAKKYGMKKQEIGGRIYEWFMAQDSIVQRAVLGLLEGLEMEAASRYMEQLADKAKQPPTGGRPARLRPPLIEKRGGVLNHRE